MRLSALFVRTQRETPAEAEVRSHELLLRAGHIRRVTSGVYAFLPLGLRVLRRVEEIVRSEMDAAGAQEVLLPVLMPRELWERTGRWEAYGPNLFRLADRKGAEYCLGPTHEELITTVVRNEYGSYRDLPVNLYQIQTKFRDELRPRSGLIRAREFLMKDAYSFDVDRAGMRVSYAAMVKAYRAIFDRCGLDYRVVEAQAGEIGGDVNHEFMALSAIGEDLFVSCDTCEYAANVEAAEARAAEVVELADSEVEPLEEVHTPGVPGIDEVAAFLGRDAGELLKCLFYMAGDTPIAVLVPGDREVNEFKLSRTIGEQALRMFGPEDFEARPNFVLGYAGPQGMRAAGVRVLADSRVRARANWVTGANRADHHATGVRIGRDFEIDDWADLANVHDGDRCPRCEGGRLVVGRSIEVGHTFQLGTRYSVPLGANFVDADGAQRPMLMGCYGIGVSRIMAAVAEQHNDEAGLCWPGSVAPAGVHLVPLGKDALVEAESVYSRLADEGIVALVDDREASAGVKFADADLMGCPIQVILGKKLREGLVEIKDRATGERTDVGVGDLSRFLRERLG
ncbi:MAG: proline--tRNA ligase [Actinomycetota bacterium]